MADIQRKFEDTPLRPMEYREAIKWSDQANEKLRAKALDNMRSTMILRIYFLIESLVFTPKGLKVK